MAQQGESSGGDHDPADRIRPARKPRADAEENRRRLVKAAGEVYGEQGSDAPLDAIAARAGVGNATLYRHFPDADSLWTAVLGVRLQEVASFLRVLEGEDDAFDALLKYIRWVAHNPDNSYSDVLLTPLDRLPAVAGQRRQLRTQIQALLDRAADSDRLRAPMTLEDINIVIFALSKVATDDRITDAQGERFLETVLVGFRR